MASFSSQTLTFTTPCRCSQILQSTDCKQGCVWSQADSSCSDVDCSIYTMNIICDSVFKCAWDQSTSKCAAFTSCEDYTVSIAGMCYAIDQSCIPGREDTEGQVTCKTAIKSCSSFQNSQECNYRYLNDKQTCWFKENACTLVEVSKCSQITDFEICILFCTWNFYINKCTPRTCVDLAIPQQCSAVWLDDFSGINICTWNNSINKCQDAADVSALTSANCFDNTFGFYYWNGNTCQQCNGSSGNDSSGNDSSGNSSSGNDLSGYGYILPVENQYFCNCSQIVQSTDCKGDCSWSSVDSSCAAKTVDCTIYTLQPICDALNTCAWNDSTQKCATFTACSNYTVTSTVQCYGKDSSCVPGTVDTDGKVTCKTGSITCSSFQNEQDCNGKQPSYTSTCWFKQKSCLELDISKCSVITEQAVCQLFCKWTSDNKCTERTCTDFITPSQCRAVWLDDFSGINICTWNNSINKCQDVADVSTLTSSNCFYNTFGYFYWDGSACQECKDSSGYIQPFIVLIIMSIF